MSKASPEGSQERRNREGRPADRVQATVSLLSDGLKADSRRGPSGDVAIFSGYRAHSSEPGFTPANVGGACQRR